MINKYKFFLIEQNLDQIQNDLAGYITNTPDKDIEDIEQDQLSIEDKQIEIETLKDQIEKLQVEEFSDENKKMVQDKIEIYSLKIEELTNIVNQFKSSIEKIREE